MASEFSLYLSNQLLLLLLLLSTVYIQTQQALQRTVCNKFVGFISAEILVRITKALIYMHVDN